MENENMEIETEEESGLVTFRMSVEEAKRLRSILSRKASGIQKPRVTRVGNKIIIDTGLDDVCTFNHGPNEIHVAAVFQKAGKKIFNEVGEVADSIPAVFIIERAEGGFCYADGKPVDKRDDLLIIPKQHLDAALSWFDAKYPSSDKAEKVSPDPSNGSNPKEEIELSLRDKVIILSAKGLSGKAISQKLKCSEGTTSIWRKKGIKEKLLAKTGKKFTATGEQKYGGIGLNI